MENKITLPEGALLLSSRLSEAGFRCFAVGGCVRDLVMGRIPHDYDLCTDALPSQILSLFHDLPVIGTGLKHGTVTAAAGGEPYEITTFRTDGTYSDGRHPDSVSFSGTVEEDLSRRDFTINAMAYSGETGILDLFGGREDIARKRIRCVGDPMERFTEDALRILRALRFASVLDFTVGEETADAMRKLAGRLSLVSAERKTSELMKILTGAGFERIFLSFPEIFAEVIPALSPCIDFDQNNPHHDFPLHVHLAKTVTFCPPDGITRLAALLHDIGKPATVSTDENGISHFIRHAHVGYTMSLSILRDLKMSRKDTETVAALVRYHDGVIPETRSALLHRLNQLGEKDLFRLLDLQRADNLAQTVKGDLHREHNAMLFHIAQDVMSYKECYTLKSLAINGYDMMNAGFSGSEIGENLRFLLNAVMEGKVKNENSALFAFLKEKKYPDGFPKSSV